MSIGHIDNQGNLLVTRDGSTPTVSTEDCDYCCEFCGCCAIVCQTGTCTSLLSPRILPTAQGYTLAAGANVTGSYDGSYSYQVIDDDGDYSSSSSGNMSGSLDLAKSLAERTAYINCFGMSDADGVRREFIEDVGGVDRNVVEYLNVGWTAFGFGGGNPYPWAVDINASAGFNRIVPPGSSRSLVGMSLTRLRVQVEPLNMFIPLDPDGEEYYRTSLRVWTTGGTEIDHAEAPLSVSVTGNFSDFTINASMSGSGGAQSFGVDYQGSVSLSFSLRFRNMFLLPFPSESV